MKTCPCRDGCLNGCPCPEYDCELPFECQDYKERSECYAKVYDAVTHEIVDSVDTFVVEFLCKAEGNAIRSWCSMLDFESWDNFLDDLLFSLEYPLRFCPCGKECPNGCPCAEYDCSNTDVSRRIDFEKIINENFGL